MYLTKCEPYQGMATIHDRLNRLFGDWSKLDITASDVDGGHWAPAVDIYETETEVVVKAELPEIDKKDVSLSIENNTLTLKGERKLENETKRESYHFIERSYGSFSRSFTLPTTIDQEHVKADYKDGVMKITLPKIPALKPKQISVNVA